MIQIACSAGTVNLFWLIRWGSPSVQGRRSPGLLSARSGVRATTCRWTAGALTELIDLIQQRAAVTRKGQ
jgi:hypothetical protein